jgi:hypothetical protein
MSIQTQSPGLTTFESNFINHVGVQAKAKLGAPETAWTFAVRLEAVRIYVLTRLEIKEIGRLLKFPDIHPK